MLFVSSASFLKLPIAHKVPFFLTHLLNTSDLDNLLPELEETYTSSLFMTEPLYQFYDKDADQLYNDKGSSEGSHSSEQMDEEDDSREEDEDEEGEEKSGEENMYESVENLLSLPSIRASLRKTRASRFLLDLLIPSSTLLLNVFNHSSSTYPPFHDLSLHPNVSQVFRHGHRNLSHRPPKLMGRTARGNFFNHQQCPHFGAQNQHVFTLL